MIEVNETFDEYRFRPELNASTAVHGLSSFRKMRWQIDNSQESSDLMLLGTAVHSMLELTPEEFANTYVVMPDFHLMEGNQTGNGDPSTSKVTKWCKDKAASWREEESVGLDREVISFEVYAKAVGMLKALHSHPLCRDVITNSKKEITVTAELLGVPCKGRIDLYDNKTGHLSDLKTTADAAPTAFGRVFARFHYGFKMRWYQRLLEANGLPVNEVSIIVCETTPWADRYLQPVPIQVLEHFDSKIDKVLKGYQSCVESGEWPGMYEQECPYLDLPYSAMEEEAPDLDWS